MRWLVPLALLLTAMSACAPSSRVVEVPLGPPRLSRADSAEAFAATADAFVASLLDSVGVVPGLSVAVVRGDEAVYLRGFGQANPEAGLAATPETVFYIASATKPFTALAAALLDARGVVDLNGPLARHFPDADLAPAVGAVPLCDLLTHTHGLANGGLVFRTAFSGEHTPARLRALVAATTPNAEAPRGTFDYTNLGYNVLALVLEHETGRPWQALLDSLVFGPLGTTRTTAVVSEAERHGWPLAVPHTGFGAGGVERLSLSKHDDTMQAAGGMLSTASDLARWVEVQLNGGRVDGRQVFPEAVVRRTHRLAATTDADYGPFHRSGYGLGWYVGEYDADTLMHHFGGFAGFHAHVSFMPEREVGVVVLANATEGGPVANLVATFAYDWWRGRPDALARAEAARAALGVSVVDGRARIAAERAARAARPWTLSRPVAAYAGTYVNALYGTMEVTVANGAPAFRIGRLHAVGAPYAEPETVRVELVPGQGEVVTFAVELGGAVGSLRYDGVVFDRVR